MVVHLFAHMGSTIVCLWLASWLHATSCLANSLLALGFLASIDNSATGVRARLANPLPCPLMLAIVSFLLAVGSAIAIPLVQPFGEMLSSGVIYALIVATIVLGTFALFALSLDISHRSLSEEFFVREVSHGGVEYWIEWS